MSAEQNGKSNHWTIAVLVFVIVVLVVGVKVIFAGLANLAPEQKPVRVQLARPAVERLRLRRRDRRHRQCQLLRLRLRRCGRRYGLAGGGLPQLRLRLWLWLRL